MTQSLVRSFGAAAIVWTAYVAYSMIAVPLIEPEARPKPSEAGVTAVIQPGGSKKDDDVIAVCNDLGLPMVFTGRRHFKH